NITKKNTKNKKKYVVLSLRALGLNSTWGLGCQIHLGVPGAKHAQFVQRFLEILEIVVIADRFPRQVPLAGIEIHFSLIGVKVEHRSPLFVDFIVSQTRQLARDEVVVAQ